LKGEFVERDATKALQLYQQASKSGDSGGSFALASLDRRGVFEGYDNQQVYDLYVLARDQGHPLADLELARATCLGVGVPKDLDSCMELLRMPLLADDPYKNYRRSVIGDILLSTLFNDEDQKQFYPVVKEAFDVAAQHARVLFNNRGPYGRGLTQDITLREGLRFGVTAWPRGPIDRSSEQKNILLKVHWSHPPVQDRWGVTLTERTYFIGIPMNELSQITLHLENESYLQEGDWHLRLYTLDDELLREISFRTFLPES
jgi:hypothetical protein